MPLDESKSLYGVVVCLFISVIACIAYSVLCFCRLVSVSEWVNATLK